MARVGIVVVSHSAHLAQGVVEVAVQMAPDVLLEAAGGLDDGGIGTSYDLVEAAVERVLAACEGVVILSDLGSALMTAESVASMADEPERIAVPDAPLVEAAVTAAISAQVGDDLAGVESAALGAGRNWVRDEGGAALVNDAPGPAPTPDTEVTEGEVTAEATIADPVGLHARPAAELAQLAASFDAEVTVNGADAASILEVMTLGLSQGDRVTVTATGPQAAEAVAAVVARIETYP
ncbi:MAG: dihydroxyacetone kinase phosphoryl donor subunit DhaM [Actinomycetaceae bacterium]|nr:dihydroxyacetone kinase phosphoryl donor subunit DhaM [Actinomycetaceae bacterium]